LESAFHKTGVSAEVQFRIVEAISEIGGKRANDLLFAKINYHQRKVRETVVKGLNRNKFEAKEAQMPLLQDLIYELCYAGAWNVAGLYTLQDLTEYDYLRRALEEEKLRNDELLFEVLGLAYDRSAVAHVQDSFMDPEIEDTGFALELLNLIVDEQVVLYLEPYFDELPIPDKIRKLQSEMPVDILKIEDLLLATISRDAMYAGNYLKLCAIEVIRDMEELDAGKYLAAQVFHSNFAISRFSASVLEDRDEAFYKELVLRKPELFQEKNIDGRKLIGLVERMGEWVSLKPQRMEYLFERIGAMLVEDEIDLEDEELVVRNLEKQRI